MCFFHSLIFTVKMIFQYLVCYLRLFKPLGCLMYVSERAHYNKVTQIWILSSIICFQVTLDIQSTNLRWKIPGCASIATRYFKFYFHTILEIQVSQLCLCIHLLIIAVVCLNKGRQSLIETNRFFEFLIFSTQTKFNVKKMDIYFKVAR